MIESLVFIGFVCEVIIIFLICKIIDKLGEINFNLEYSCSKTEDYSDGRNPTFLENLELRNVISDYENTIKQLKKENQKLKHYKKGYKTLQKNNQKLQERVDCLESQLSDKSDSVDGEEWSESGVIYE